MLERITQQPSWSIGAVLLDEAHHLDNWPAAEQQALREFLRNDTRLGVLVASSEAGALEALVQPGGPLQYVGSRIDLPAIHHDDWRAALRDRFAQAGCPVHEDALERLLAESMGHPYCTMLLARESALAGGAFGFVSVDHVRAGLLVARADDAWELRHDQLG